MSTIRFEHHEKLNELIARIYLDTHKKLTKKELLGYIFELGIKNYDNLLKKVRGDDSEDDEMEKRKRFIENFCGCITIPNLKESVSGEKETDEVSFDEKESNPKKIWEKHMDIE